MSTANGRASEIKREAEEAKWASELLEHEKAARFGRAKLVGAIKAESRLSSRRRKPIGRLDMAGSFGAEAAER